MSEMFDQLWPAFLAEVTEQLESLEVALAGGAKGAGSDINQLFRDFHTIKSSCGMMDYSSMEEIAHTAEDLLELVRRGEMRLDDEITDALLRAVDALKSQLASAGKTKRNPTAQPKVIAALRALATRGSAPSAAAPAPAPEPAAETEAPPKASTKASTKAAAKKEPPAPAAQPQAEAPSADPNESVARFESFAALCREALPGAAVAAIGAARGGAGVGEQLQGLVFAAQALGFHAVARTLLAFDRATQADSGRRVAELLERLRFVEQLGNVDCGSAAVAAAVRDLVLAPFTNEGRALCAEIERLQKSTAPAATIDVSAATRRVDAVVPLAELLGYRDTARAMRFARQVLREIGRGNLPADAFVLESLAIACGLIIEVLTVEHESESFLALCQEAIDDLRRAVSDEVVNREMSAKLGTIRSRMGEHSSFIGLLNPRAVDLLLAAMQRGEFIVEIEADLESARAVGERFVSWLGNQGQIISNRTVFHRTQLAGRATESTRLRFMVALHTPLPELKRFLGELDPSRVLFELHTCDYEGGPKAQAAPEAAPSNQVTTTTTDTLRIDSAMLDKFVTRVGEMVMQRNMLSHAIYDDRMVGSLNRGRRILDRVSTSRIEPQDVAQLTAILGSLVDSHERLVQADRRLQNSLNRLQEDVLDLRVVPIALVFNRLPRAVRSLAQEQGKQIDLVVEGETVRIDKGMVDILIEPMLHLVRNAVDHGIETPEQRIAAGKPGLATLQVRATLQGDALRIDVGDDGRGLDYARIREHAVTKGLVEASAAAGLTEAELQELIFRPGFSTAATLTETSGRGVGMDAIKTRIQQLGGQIEIKSEAGKGATFSLRLPLSAAIQGVVLVVAGQQTFAVPERSVGEVFSVRSDTLQSVQGQSALLLRGSLLPVYRLDSLLGLAAPAGRPASDEIEVVTLTSGLNRIGLVVDQVYGRQEVFVRELHDSLATLSGVGGASILGDGRVVIIVDGDQLIDLAARSAQSLRTLLRAS